MNRTLLSGTGIVLAVILFFAVNILAGTALRGARIDLTEAKLYTLSDGSKSLLAKLQEPIQLRFYYSQAFGTEVPQIGTYGDRVRELLEQYAARSSGHIKLEVIDPEPFSEAEDRAKQAGLESLDRNGRPLYFGLIGTNSIDTQEVVAFFSPDREQFLEYDLTKLVYTLTAPKKPVIGLVTSLPLDYGPGGVMAAMRGQSQPYAIMQQLRQFFDVRTLDTTFDRVPEEMRVLIVAHARGLSPAATYAIDQFVMRGGRVIAFTDPYSETAATLPDPMGRPQQPGADQSSLLPDLFKSWGIEVAADTFVADLGLAQRVQASPRQVVDYVAWQAIPAANISREDLVVADTKTLNSASPGAIKRAEGATTTLHPLVHSSDRAMLVSTEKLIGQPDPQGLLNDFKATGERYVLAARVTGPVKSAFAGPPPAPARKEGEAEEKKPEPLPAHIAQADNANIIVIADADMLDDRFWVQEQNMMGGRVLVPMADNGTLLVNAVDNMSGSNDLIALRSRGRSQRPFDRIEDLRRNASQQFQARQTVLQKDLEETEKKIAELQTKAGQGASAAILSREEQTAIDDFRVKMVQTRQELRGVQRDLNKDVQRVETWVKFVNIGLIPLLVALFAIGLGFVWRARRRRPQVQERAHAG
jgi:ABC-type uncharacterized transport system involved in gliding motility auxiliary subunit